MEIQHAARQMGIRLIKYNANDYVAVDVRTNKVVKRSTNRDLSFGGFKEGLFVSMEERKPRKGLRLWGNSHGQLGLGDTN